MLPIHCSTGNRDRNNKVHRSRECCLKLQRLWVGWKKTQVKYPKNYHLQRWPDKTVYNWKMDLCGDGRFYFLHNVEKLRDTKKLSHKFRRYNKNYFQKILIPETARLCHVRKSQEFTNFGCSLKSFRTVLGGQNTDKKTFIFIGYFLYISALCPLPPQIRSFRVFSARWTNRIWYWRAHIKKELNKNKTKLLSCIHTNAAGKNFQ